MREQKKFIEWDHLHFDNNEFLGFISGQVVGTFFASIRVINMDARVQHGREVSYFWQFKIQVQL